MNRKALLALASLGLAGWAAYRRRRELLARGLQLPPAQYETDVEYGLRIPMRDGITLAADHYCPRAAGAFPTILIRTPYGRGRGSGLLGLIHVFVAQRFAERGYHVVAQDTRGRFDSEGTFVPFVNERADGLDTLDWIARQPWFDGRLGMWGQSYEGYVQWAVAADAPDFLRVLNPSITGSRLNPYTGSAFGLDTMLRWVMNLTQGGKPDQLSSELKNMLNPRAATRALAEAFSRLPLGEADVPAVGQTVAYYREWLEHPVMDAPYWQNIYYGTRMEAVRAAVHLVSGWYDILLYQLLQDYAALRRAGHTPYLTIGPWRHNDLGGATEALHTGILWSEAQLKGDRRYLRDHPVRLYVMSAGGGAWRNFDTFPPPATETRLYLHPEKQLAHSLPPASAEPDTYCYDPHDPTPAVGGPLYHQEGGARDNRALEARPDVLTFTTAPLERDILIIGPVRLELFVHSSLDYTDFFGRVCDAYPDGRSINVCDGLVRLVPEEGPVQTDGSRRITVDLWATAYRFRTGHAIRLLVASGAHPRWARNPGTGEPLATATQLRAANQTVFHDAAHPSALVLPVMAG